MELYRKVRLACREGMSERAAARNFGVLRESVRKMLRFSVPPGYRRKTAVRRPKLDGFTELIDQWLVEDRKWPRKQRHTAKRVFERLRTEYRFGGTYTTVRKGRMRSLNPARKLNTGTPATASRMSPSSAQLPKRRLSSR